MNKKLLGFFIILIVALGGSSVYFYLQNQDLKEQINLSSEEKNKQIIAEVNEVYDLPEEDAVVALVRDAEEFKKEYPSYDDVEVLEGDYLLFFRKARLTVLYRQSEKKVVKTANVVVPITVEIIGSEKATAQIEQQLAQFGQQISIVKTVQDGVTSSFIYDVDQDQAEDVASIAEQIGFETAQALASSFEPGAQTEIVIAVSDDASDTLEPVQDSNSEQNTESAEQTNDGAALNETTGSPLL